MYPLQLQGARVQFLIENIFKSRAECAADRVCRVGDLLQRAKTPAAPRSRALQPSGECPPLWPHHNTYCKNVYNMYAIYMIYTICTIYSISSLTTLHIGSMHNIHNIYIHHTTYWENTRYVWRINIDPRCALYHIHPPLLRVYQFFVHILYEIQRVAWAMLCKRCSGQFCTTVQSSAQTTTN